MRSHAMLARLCVVALLSSAHADAQGPAPSEEDADQQFERSIRHYAGVKPGGDERPATTAKPGSTPAAITWPGFQMMPDGGSRVFVQITTQVDVSAALVNGQIIVDLGDVAIAGRNNRRPLITKFFNTPVTLVEVKRAKKRTTLILSMREPIEPRVSHERAESGYHFVYLDFPPGNYLANGAEVAAAAPAVDLPEAAKPVADATMREAPTHLEGGAATSGQVKASAGGGVGFGANARAGASSNRELPPGVAAPKARAKAGGTLNLGGK
jgi:hypothetical protein